MGLFHHRLTLEPCLHDKPGNEILVTKEDKMGLIREHRLALRFVPVDTDQHDDRGALVERVVDLLQRR